MRKKNYAIIKFQKLNRNKIQEIKMRCEHVNRKLLAKNVDGDRCSKNRCIIGEENTDWYFAFKTRHKELSHYREPGVRKLQKNAVIGVEIITSMSHDVAEEIDIEMWCEANNTWMKKEFGEENVIQGVLHMDEGTPHIHYFVTPVLNGRFNARDILGNRGKYIERQTSYANAMGPLGLVRGEKNERLDYVSIQELYYRTAEGIEDLPFVHKGETAEEFRERANELYRGHQLRANKILNEDRLLKNYARKAIYYKEKCHELLAEISDLETALDNCNIGGIKIKYINAALEKHHDKATITLYIKDFLTLEKIGKELLELEQELSDEFNYPRLI